MIMAIKAVSLGLVIFIASIPTHAQRDMRDGRIGSTTSSDATSRAAISLDAKNNPELYRLSQKTGESIAHLKDDFRASEKIVPALSLNEFSQMKLASKEFKLKFADIVHARQSAPDLEHTLRQFTLKVDPAQFQQKLANIQGTANIVAPPN
jgi:hypothetical protein